LNDYERYDGVGLAELVAHGDVKPEELLEAALTRMAERDRTLNSVVIPMVEHAHAAIAAGLPAGPLRGVPYLVKDLYANVRGVRTTHGCRLFEDYVPDYDSEMTLRIRAAGLVVFGKTHSPEFGITTSSESRLFGKTRNPWDLERTAGGSSGGAAAAVAAGIVPWAHASDGGGSIRIPASCCGLVGLKPSRGRTPMGPDVGEGWSGMSQVHAVTRSVRDCAALLDATHGPDVGAPYVAPAPARAYRAEVGADPGRLRIALQTQTWNGAPVHADCRAAVEDAGRLLESLGHQVEDAPFPVDRERFRRSTITIIAANLLSVLEQRAAELGRPLQQEDVEPGTWVLVSLGKTLRGTDYVAAVRGIHALGRQLGRFLQDFDLLLSPTMATPPLPLGALALDCTDLAAQLANLEQTVGFTQLFNATGTPAISLPLSWNAAGLPIGVQLCGALGDEARLLRVAAQCEQARPWLDRRPAGFSDPRAGSDGPAHAAHTAQSDPSGAG
jgi:Asp-tRNA(Asn)/Glu-tRNA(Gln) amidotransferase A subunit family amidase